MESLSIDLKENDTKNLFCIGTNRMEERDTDSSTPGDGKLLM